MGLVFKTGYSFSVGPRVRVTMRRHLKSGSQESSFAYFSIAPIRSVFQVLFSEAVEH